MQKLQISAPATQAMRANSAQSRTNPDVNQSHPEFYNFSSSNQTRTNLMDSHQNLHPALGAIDASMNSSMRNMHLISAVNQANLNANQQEEAKQQERHEVSGAKPPVVNSDKQSKKQGNIAQKMRNNLLGSTKMEGQPVSFFGSRMSNVSDPDQEKEGRILN
jgi:hypothetical protein